MTLIDLRLLYKQDTGDASVPISHGYYDELDYILWLEEKLLEKFNEKLEDPEFIEFKEMTEEELFNL